MRCAYCFYQDVARHRERACGEMMTTAVAQAIVERACAAADAGATVTFAFQGGEPTLAGLPFFKDFVAYAESQLRDVRVRYALQTNGLLLDEEWAAFLAEKDFLVGVSVDGWRELHDAQRPAASGEGTYAAITRSMRLLRAAGVRTNVLSVLTSQMAAHPQRAFKALVQSGVDYVQYVPCLAELDEEQGADACSLTPAEFAHFYKGLLNSWMAGLRQGRHVHVGLLEDVMALSLGMPPSQCGMLGSCAPQLVVESNGDVFPCDFYATDEWRCGNIQSNTIDELLGSSAAARFCAAPRRSCAACEDCPFEGMCHRGCRRLGAAFYDQDRCGYREFLEYGYDALARAARVF